jgi:hypothetical protein
MSQRGDSGRKINTDEHDRSRTELDANRTAPLYLAFYEEETIANELAACNTSGLETTFDHDPAAAALRLGALGLPWWNYRNLQAETNARYDTADGELSDALGDRLQCAANDHENHAKEDCRALAKSVT